MNITRRRAALGSLASLAAPRLATAQSYPTRPIRIVIPYAAGGGSDSVGRLFYARLSEALGQPIVIENRGGGGGTIGANAVARAANDGYTLLHDTSAFAVNPFLLPSLPYDAVRDFTPIFLAATVPTMLTVHPSVEARTVPELIELVKRTPGGVECASAGNGTMQHLGLELFRLRTGAPLNHVPYRGGAPAVSDLIGGQIKYAFVDGAAILPFLRAGQVRALAHNGTGRLAALPNLPAMSEFIPDFEAVVWNGLIAPAGTPEPVIRRLNTELNGMLGDPHFVERLDGMNMATRRNTPEEFRSFLAAEMQRWGTVVREARITVG
ncbi:Bug family tripartite tricarboxylate transporter substrate binding protein [Roseococcus pinisoli]|uniref:Tripartite tricarboxylate transporter substrate binding protein n=1 Tax=Roseococcus pinisoli TaxID=2835040 RepID=A0ABS5QF07_9PROT|nr:tripartite tricarboxylate transporter substrate binding protein [Roseococcus pinisoli]MBS7811507.1 tripartite tricarboxylate transporter substrate binding protein [Roseococcus pinisoli]